MRCETNQKPKGTEDDVQARQGLAEGIDDDAKPTKSRKGTEDAAHPQ